MDFLVEEEKNPVKDHSLWVERYRPKTLEDYIGNETVKEKVAEFLRKNDVPHLLFFGPAGTGKTSLAKLISKGVNCDVLYMNASDERKLDDVRDKMKSFACSAGFKPLKLLILDEADKLTPDAQGALRNMIESYSAHTRFILTCNYKQKMIDPIVSRLQAFEIKPLSKKDVALKLLSVLQKENVQFTQEDIVFIVTNCYPDIRRVINLAQQSTIENADGVRSIKIAKENAIKSDALTKLIDCLKTPNNSQSFSQIREVIADLGNDSLESVVRHLFDKVGEYANGKESLIIFELGECNWQMELVIPAVRDITFLACIYKILKHLK